jgi:mono/diheme cytochrome c family protein
MHIALRALLYSSLAIGFVAGGTAAYWELFLPRVEPPKVGPVPKTPDRLARGQYIFEVVSDCNGCHSERDFTRFGGPVIPGTVGKGQELKGMGLPGRVVAANITPDRETGIGAWTDGEKIRAIREGVDRDGRTLFPMMPYAEYRSMSDYDVESLVAYLDSLPPIRNQLPKTQVPFPVSILIRSAPRPAHTVMAPQRGRTAEYGAYLVTIGGCAGCHTQEEHGKPKIDMRLAGGREFQTPWGVVASANISPDPETGIGSWNESYFIQRFTLQKQSAHTGSRPVGPKQFTLMPWLNLSQMNEDDLAAIFKYLQTQPAIRNKVETHPEAPKSAGVSSGKSGPLIS